MNNTGRKIIVLLAVLVFLIIVDAGTGSTSIGLNDLVRWIAGKTNETEKIIIEQIRIPRVITAVFAGMALGISGLIMQTVFENPLAGPYILGISSGAGFGVAVSILGAGWAGINLQWAGYTTGAFAGALLVTIIILWLSYKYSSVIVLIAGVMLSGIFGALTSVMQAFSSAEKLKSYILWTFGTTEAQNYEQLTFLALLTIIIFILAIVFSRSLDVLYLGEEQAQATGLNIKTAKILSLGSISILTAAVTALCGPIAFVGIISPHLARAVVKDSRHKILLPATAIIASIIVVSGDMISHAATTGIPLNAILSLIGIPVLLYFVLKGNNYIF